MIITCPNCHTRFQINPASLRGGGRTVRCSSCAHRWFAEPFVEAPPAAPAPEPPGGRRDDPDAPGPAGPRRPTALAASPPGEATPLDSAPRAPARDPAGGEDAGGGAGVLAGWLLLALVVLLLAAAVLGRNEIAGAFPATLALYERLGLQVAVPLGLEFADLASARRGAGQGGAAVPGGGGGTVAVTGAIRNVSGREVRVPKLRVALLDERRGELRAALFDPPQAVLPPGGSARFELDLADPPPEARDFSISFDDRP